MYARQFDPILVGGGHIRQRLMGTVSAKSSPSVACRRLYRVFRRRYLWIVRKPVLTKDANIVLQPDKLLLRYSEKAIGSVRRLY